MKSEAEQFEKIPTVYYPSSSEACRVLAVEVASLIRQKQAEGRPAVLGLATGSTPVPFYRELIRMHREEGLSFRNVITFNLDEYYGLERQHHESYYRFMREQLFDHIDLPDKQINIPPGTVARDEVYAACQDYENRIADAGGIDLQILGIGRTGHIGFNEPGSTQDSPTRMITLDKITREDAARDFLGIENVPRFALTMGVGTILKARRIVLLAWGENKANIVAEAVEGLMTDAVSASFLQSHPNAQFILDEGAARSLTRLKRPWLVGTVDWNDQITRQAVTWLSQKLQKPVLKLLDEDYNEHGMGDLLTEHGPAYQLNIRVFNDIQHTITGWPGGKPNEADTYRPERATPYPKRVLILAPEPIDELRSMGGTINRLVNQGHRVDIAFLTSGSLNVSDRGAEHFADVLQDVAQTKTGASWKGPNQFATELLQDIANKGPFGSDTASIRGLKGMIRRGEARQALKSCGVSPSRIHFLDLPFYEKGRYRRFALGEEDEETLRQFLTKHKPHQIYMTGSASDPSSVAGMCYRLFLKVILAAAKRKWRQQCRIWIYRAQEKPLEAHEIHMAVPMSPSQLKEKIAALSLYNYADEILPGERDQENAEHYDALGMAEYEAIEAFEAFRAS